MDKRHLEESSSSPPPSPSPSSSSSTITHPHDSRSDSGGGRSSSSKNSAAIAQSLSLPLPLNTRWTIRDPPLQLTLIFRFSSGRASSGRQFGSYYFASFDIYEQQRSRSSVTSSVALLHTPPPTTRTTHLPLNQIISIVCASDSPFPVVFAPPLSVCLPPQFLPAHPVLRFALRFFSLAKITTTKQQQQQKTTNPSKVSTRHSSQE